MKMQIVGLKPRMTTSDIANVTGLSLMRLRKEMSVAFNLSAHFDATQDKKVSVFSADEVQEFIDSHFDSWFRSSRFVSNQILRIPVEAMKKRIQRGKFPPHSMTVREYRKDQFGSGQYGCGFVEVNYWSCATLRNFLLTSKDPAFCTQKELLRMTRRHCEYVMKIGETRPLPQSFKIGHWLFYRTDEVEQWIKDNADVLHTDVQSVAPPPPSPVGEFARATRRTVNRFYEDPAPDHVEPCKCGKQPEVKELTRGRVMTTFVCRCCEKWSAVGSTLAQALQVWNQHQKEVTA